MRSFLANSVKGDSLVAVLSDGTSYTADKTHSNWNQLAQALKNKDAEAFVDAFDLNKVLENYVTGPTNVNVASGCVKVVDGQIFYGKEALRSTLVDRIYEMMNRGYDFIHMLTFLDNLHENPSKNSFDQLHSFLENAFLPITPDGCFLAYKTVRVHTGDRFTDEYGNVVDAGDYVDKYTGSVRNNVGDEPWMSRNKVTDNPDVHCSHGYHVGALAYAGPGGWYNSSNDVVVIVKVDPRDAVSVPNDHSCQKLRVCRYTVVGLYQGELVRPVYNVDDEDFEYDDSFDDDLAEDEPDFFEEEYESADSFWVGDEMVCVYEKADGTVANRVVQILEVDVRNRLYIVELLQGDAKHDIETTNIRNFKFDSISKSQYLER